MAKASFTLSFLVVAALALLSTSNACHEPRSSSAGIFELRRGDFSVKVTNWGATILSVIFPDSNGSLLLSSIKYTFFISFLQQKNSNYFGSIVGRVANRISGGQFVLNGVVYRLNKNDGNNTLHGGSIGFSQVLWTVKEQGYGELPYITFYYRSFDGEQGFPGALDVYVTYRITAAYQLRVSMYAKPLNKPTPINLAQHTYWNLGGHNSGTILSNNVQIFSSRTTTVDAQLIPTGEFSSVSNTPYDFQQPMTIDSRINQINTGYDIYYVLNQERGCEGLWKAAMVRDNVSGRKLELWTNQLGLQFYTANTLNEERGKGNQAYRAYAGLCLETQGFPDSMNHPNFPSTYVNPGEEYKHEMLFKFSF
ncbi:aldose 1-epimerase-like [Canna indica]|uniref:Aldose 1-epimerase n=1 Tax=Canna indica TaxID=4628 RepID=A0AAQ3JR15_9LILI|nr:aldose 1-epimerase-like [Canna indica]